MQVILHLVGFGPNKPVADTVHGRKERVFVCDTKVTKLIAHLPIEPTRERATATQLVFINPALAFVHTHRHTCTHRCQQMGRVNPLLIGGVADLVDSRIKAVERIDSIRAGRNPHVQTRPA